MFVSYAQNFEDVMLWRALKHIENGFYLDIGAQDPVVDSVSRGFYEQGWRGVHVEPTSEYAQRLRINRPDEIVFQKVVGSGVGTIPFYEFPETGLSTGDASIAQQHIDKGFICQETLAEQTSLAELFELCAGNDIHWLKIDVEGMEGAVLASWGSSEKKPWIVVVEATRPASEERVDSQWAYHLFDRGYQLCYFDGLNCYFVSDHHSYLKPSFQAPPNVFDEFTVSGLANSRVAHLLNEKIHELADRLKETDAKLAEEISQKNNVERLLNKKLETVVIKLDETRAKLADGVLTQNDLRDKCDSLEVALLDVHNSTSWKITQPLRVMASRSRWLAQGALSWASFHPASRPRRVVSHFVTYLMLRARNHPRLARFLLDRSRLLPAFHRRVVLAAHARGMALSIRPDQSPGDLVWHIDVDPEIISRLKKLGKE